MKSKHFVEKKRASITFRVNEEIKDEAQKVAFKDNKSLSYLMERVLMRELGLLDPQMK